MISSKRLAYYNNREFAVPTRKAVTKACAVLGLAVTELEAEVSWSHNSSVSVIHGQVVLEQDTGGFQDVDYYEVLQNEKVESANELAVIFISSERAPEIMPAMPVHFRRADGTRSVRYLLPIRRTIESGLTTRNVEDEPDEDLVNRWVSLLEAVTTPGVLEEWFKASGSGGVNSILNEMLLEPIAPESLIALLVLCQGYLAVHAFHHNGEHQSDEVKDALRDSGVENAINDTTLNIPQLTTVSNPVWWQEVFGPTTPDLKLLVAREWGTDIEKCPKAVQDLIDAILAGPVGPQVVAEGYLAIATKLRTA
jgi:hypothetical protein